MSFKPTIILASILILLAGYLVYFHLAKSEVKKDERPEIWSVEEEKIHQITIRLPHEKKMMDFFKDKDERWRFDDETRQPVDIQRWGGIVLLVSGPKSKRMIAEKVEDLGEYGFTDPQMIVTLDIRGQKDPLEILFGGRTPQEDQFYVKLKHKDPVYIMHSNYCEVLRRLALEPPRPARNKSRTEKMSEKMNR